MRPTPRLAAAKGIEDCASKLKVLADPTRLGVLSTLLSAPRHVAELSAELCVEQSLMSHHLRVLRDAGLVETRRDGRSVLYHIAPGALAVEGDARALRLGCCDLSFEAIGLPK